MEVISSFLLWRLCSTSQQRARDWNGTEMLQCTPGRSSYEMGFICWHYLCFVFGMCSHRHLTTRKGYQICSKRTDWPIASMCLLLNLTPVSFVLANDIWIISLLYVILSSWSGHIRTACGFRKSLPPYPFISCHSTCIWSDCFIFMLLLNFWNGCRYSIYCVILQIVAIKCFDDLLLGSFLFWFVTGSCCTLMLSIPRRVCIPV